MRALWPRLSKIELYDRNNHVRSDLIEQLHGSKLFNGQSRAIQDWVLSELGGQGTANLLFSPQYNRLMKGTAGGGPSDEDVRNAEKLKANFAILSKSTNDIQQIIYGDLSPAVNWFVEGLTKIEKADPKAAAHGVEVIGGALLLLSGALTGAGILRALKTIKDLKNILGLLRAGGALGEGAAAAEGAASGTAAAAEGGGLLSTLGMGALGRALPWVAALWPNQTASNDTIDQSKTGSLQDLVGAVGMRESSGRATIVNPTSGATGLMQFMPRIAKAYGIDPRDPVHIHTNSTDGAKIGRDARNEIAKKVQAVKAGDGFAGFVDVLPMVHQQDAQGRPFPHGVLHDVPYMRIQGGASALIIDPSPGDIGFIIVAGRDMTHAITNRSPSPPASFREFAMQDCVYLGGFLNNNPTQYIQATSDGWRIVTPGTVDIQASGVTANCDITTSGDVKAGGISLKNHTHSGAQPGSGNTGSPQ